MFPWHWVSSWPEPLPADPTKKLSRFRLGMTAWVLYAGLAAPNPDAEDEDEDAEGILWVLARRPAASDQLATTSVANGLVEIPRGADPRPALEHVLDLATRQAQKITYMSYGVWAFILLALSWIGGGYAIAVGVSTLVDLQGRVWITEQPEPFV